MTFAEKVKEARKQLGLSQEKFVGKMGVSFSTINRWEKGRFLPSYLAQAQFDSFCKDIQPVISGINKEILCDRRDRAFLSVKSTAGKIITAPLRRAVGKK